MAMRLRAPKYAVVIAGGEATRLRPITYEIPKPLMPVKGKPILEYTIDSLAQAGVEEVMLALGYKADMIRSRFKDGSDFGIRIRYGVEGRPLGTGGALKSAIEKLLGRKGKASGHAAIDDILTIDGDNLYKIDIRDMYSLHRSEGALVTIAAKEVDDVTGLGVLTLEGNTVKRFVEKPDPKFAESRIVNSGACILSSKAIELMPNKKAFSLERDFFQGISGKGKICAYIMKGQWFPADTLERYEKAIMGWKP